MSDNPNPNSNANANAKIAEAVERDPSGHPIGAPTGEAFSPNNFKVARRTDPIKREWAPSVVGDNPNLERKESVEHLKCFEVWYACNRNILKAAKQTGFAHMTIRRWRIWFNWDDRADARDIQAKELADKQAVFRQAEMLTKHYDAGEALIDRGLEYLNAFPIDNARDAINAIKTGVDVQRRNQGLPDWITQISSSSDGELVDRARDLIQQLNDQRQAEKEAEGELGYDEDDDNDEIDKGEVNRPMLPAQASPASSASASASPSSSTQTPAVRAAAGLFPSARNGQARPEKVKADGASALKEAEQALKIDAPRRIQFSGPSNGNGIENEIDLKE